MASRKKPIVRENTLQMRVNDEEMKVIEDKANRIGLTVSNYMRMVCLNANVIVSLKTEHKE